MLAKKLSQPLISNQRPLASVCYPSSPDFSSERCPIAVQNSTQILFIVSSTNAIDYANWEGLVTENGEVQQCVFNPASNATCFQGRVPSYVVTANTVEDIQHTIGFASDHNLHLVVKNTGHELIGRAFGKGSVELFVNRMNSINISDSFVPCGAPIGTEAEHAITVGPGVSFDEVYRTAFENGRVVAGGWSVNGTVAAGAGWPLGGGHSLLSPKYGLGVDNVLEIKVVLPNTLHITANHYQNTDLFWALRGGAGPSFGVVTSVTYKTHPDGDFTGLFFQSSTNSTDSYVELLSTFANFHNPIADAGWSGLWIFFQEVNSLFLTFVTEGTPNVGDKANTTFQNFISAARDIPGVNITQSIAVPFQSYFDFVFNTLVDTSAGFGIDFVSLTTSGGRSFNPSWLLSRNSTDPSNAKKLGNVLANITNGIGFLDLGGAVSEIPVNATAVSPGFRHSISDLSVLVNFNAEDATTANEVHNFAQAAHDQLAPLRELSPPPFGGQYVNEPDILLENWQEATWGSNYQRLLAIKKEIDPKDLFIVRQGVNSEGWDYESVCKVE
ncbi:hypothetical protein VKT23_013799 [Stygiomarasmius scandens]|uniref:FAD-binding PCMH-type domain-containing protein n=1 Tax=Marasmiellus scandens TaxID=2682957 RepID=A0ABR1J253_9AGAR